MIVVGLHGPYGAGKDTAFEVIQEWASERGVLAVRRGFADLLKLSVARIFQPDIRLEDALNWAEEFKHHGTVQALQRHIEEHSEVPGGAAELYWEPEFNLTGRELLQRYGTECHREVFGDNFWVDQLLPLDELARLRAITKFMRDTGDPRISDICCITDLRFENEAKRIRDSLIDGLVWRIDPGDRLPQNDMHISEKPLSSHLVHHVIWNDGSLAQFKHDVRVMCNTYLHDRIPK